MDDLFSMTDAEHREWLREQGIPVVDLSQPSEEALCQLVSDALRALNKDMRAGIFVDIANMSLALADKTLGAQTVALRCLVPGGRKH